jgi:LysM repeat protein
MGHCLEQELRRVCCTAAAVIGSLACAREPAPPEATPRPQPAPAAAPHAAQPAPTALYVVHEGESLGELARCSGVSVRALARDNGIPDPNRVFAGEKLRLPADHRCGAAPSAKAPPATHPRARSLQAQAVAALDSADFERALELAGQCVDGVPERAVDAKAKEIRARCHVVAAAAATGLDRRELAVAELRRALALDPDLELAPEAASPRVRELLEVARSSPSP